MSLGVKFTVRVLDMKPWKILMILSTEITFYLLTYSWYLFFPTKWLEVLTCDIWTIINLFAVIVFYFFDSYLAATLCVDHLSSVKYFIVIGLHECGNFGPISINKLEINCWIGNESYMTYSNYGNLQLYCRFILT